MNGTLNAASASSLLRRLKETEFSLVHHRLGREGKEQHLGTIRSLRNELGFEQLPPYNSTAFCRWSQHVSTRGDEGSPYPSRLFATEPRRGRAYQEARRQAA
ncbi:hypothetical protein [Sphingopyxis sp.]|jgi:hypothetical protein|uniref:hypothetical protein n=1 Tax=Sphingopyxis sp. TaxID=1908224 RepID=UPI003F713257